jgi:peptidylprolyl isomerase
MTSRERGILFGLALVLAAAIVFIVTNRDGDGPAPPAAKPTPQDWDTSRLPSLGPVLREFETPGGVVVQVLREGKGEPRKKGQAMDVAYAGYTLQSGAQFERGTIPNLVLERGGVIQGWLEGLAGTRVRELRRILIPSHLAYGERGSGKIRPNSDLAFDVEWVQLEIEDLKVGTGKTAKVGDKIVVHYRGTLENGVEFDSSYKRNQPAEFTLKQGGLIDGWVRGIPGMKVGGTRKLWIPSHLAYGDRRQGEKIAPYSNLEFVIELLGID